MKQTRPECKAQAHTSPYAVSQGRKDKQPHCGWCAVPRQLCQCCCCAIPLPAVPGQKCRVSANSTLLEWPTDSLASHSGPFLTGFGGSQPHPDHLVGSLPPVLSPHSSLKETSFLVAPSSLFHPCSSCIPSGLSQGKAKGAPWNHHQDTLKASLERSS